MLLNFGVGKDLRVPWTARRSTQSILKQISPEYSLEGVMLKLKLQYFGHLMLLTMATQHNVHSSGGDRGKQEGICILQKCHKLQRNAMVMFQINRS